MLVYGDPQFDATIGAMCAHIRMTLPQCRGGNLDNLRALLIQAGQLEQAVEDECESEQNSLAANCRRLTDWAAAAFYAAWADGDVPHSRVIIKEALARCELELEKLTVGQEKGIRLKVPEGFEFYALYPEQYAAAAMEWSKEHGSDEEKSVWVIGLRSIGTTLSAVVTASLHAAGWRVCRKTVRPKGDPFQRRIDLGFCGKAQCSTGCSPGRPSLPAKWAIVVDEGPGLSGSSLVGTAETLMSAGYKQEQIAILPGHEGEPGAATSLEIRRRWSSLKKYYVPLTEIRWSGRTLLELLGNRAAELNGKNFSLQAGADDTSTNVLDDLSGGLWRRFAYPCADAWPAVAAQFERVKYRVLIGAGGAVVWKFIGLGALVQSSGRGDDCIQQQMLDAKKFSPEVLGTFRGFLAQQWVEGRRLTAGDADIETLRHIARYLAATAGDPMSASENEAALRRLVEMLFANTEKFFGTEYSPRKKYLVSEIAAQIAGLPTYSDGRMGPQEWVRTPAGELFKLDSAGHTFDHTLVGRQAIAWDIAGVLVEWKLDVKHSAVLLEELGKRNIQIASAVQDFYNRAYAAFRLGQMQLWSKSLAAEDPDQRRLKKAIDYYAQAALMPGLKVSSKPASLCQ